MTVVELREHNKMTVKETLACASREDWEEVMVLGYINGHFEVLTSRMELMKALWLVEQERQYIFNMRDSDA